MRFVYDFAEGSKDQADLLGGKGANLAEMTNLGLPVPPGFTITTDACREYLRTGQTPPELAAEVADHLDRLERRMARTLGDASDPLLVSVRSGAKFSMPGMMETVLNVGLTDESVQGLAKQAGGDENAHRFAWDSYRRLIQMFGKTVLGVHGDLFEDALQAAKNARGVTEDVQLDADALRELVDVFKSIVRDSTGAAFPQDPREQMRQATLAVFASWNGERARVYRRQERIADDLGTAVNIVAMVFGNLGADSGTGVAFTRDPGTGARGSYGDYLPNAQGEDVVAGVRNTVPLTRFAELQPKAHADLMDAMAKLEGHYRDLCDIEFTVERGALWLLQTRVGKRTAGAAFRIASQLVDEHVIDIDEALLRVRGEQLAQLMFPRFDEDAARAATRLARGIPASPGAAVGRAVFDAATAVEWAAKGEPVILVRRETNPDDLAGMIAAAGVLTSRGGKTSHAAVVARGLGKTCVCGAEEIDVDVAARQFTAAGTTITEGDTISIDGATGAIFAGEIPVVDSIIVDYFEGKAVPAAGVASDPEGSPKSTQSDDEAAHRSAASTSAGISKHDSDERESLVGAVHRLMTRADQIRRMRVRANADTGPDAARARRFGAEGIGLCRTEHMFLGERRVFIERVILAESKQDRGRALEPLLELQRDDFTDLLRAMDGQPVTVRLIDPPLHEFLPDLVELSVRVAVAAERGEAHEHDENLRQAVARLHEQNPMLGLRGVRLGLVMPELFDLQVRAVGEATAALLRDGFDPRPEIMIPLVGAARELEQVRAASHSVLAEVSEEQGVDLHVPIGTMIELPRAALTAGDIAESADFFSFGTNDLTQTTWGFSRDDVESAFFSTYLENRIFPVSPFETIDADGVGELVHIGTTRGRATKPDLKVGVCGEHGGDPESIHFFHATGLDYVSCSPFRVPIARLEAARAVLSR